MPETNLTGVKNPHWPEANQLAIYKVGRGFEPETTVKKSSWRSGRDLISGPPNYKSSALTARPLCLHRVSELKLVINFGFYV